MKSILTALALILATGRSDGQSTDDPTREPSREPSAAPTFVKCNTNDAFNIAFLLDVDENEWDVIKTFVDRIVLLDVAPPSYVSLFKYGSWPEYTQFLDWTVASDSTAISRALDQNLYNTGGLTYTWNAVNRVLDEFWNYRDGCTCRFDGCTCDGCDKRADLLFLLTDGKPTDSPCGDTEHMIPRVNASRVDIVIVAIGNDVETWKETRTIACLDFKDGGKDIIVVTEFDSDGFNAIEGRIREKTCNGQNPEGDSQPAGNAWVYDDGSVGLGPVPPAPAAMTPVTPAPVSPTTASPTTSSPTSSPTTAYPTTAPTGSIPTTASPTTSSPTTASPTTSSPTTASPTTASPTSETTTPVTTTPVTTATNKSRIRARAVDEEQNPGYDTLESGEEAADSDSNLVSVLAASLAFVAGVCISVALIYALRRKGGGEEAKEADEMIVEEDVSDHPDASIEMITETPITM